MSARRAKRKQAPAARLTAALLEEPERVIEVEKVLARASKRLST